MSEALKGLAPEMVNYTDEEGFQAAGGWFPAEGITQYVRADALAALQAENERLREALLPFSQMAIRNGVEVVCDVVPKHVARARAALKGETP